MAIRETIIEIFSQLEGRYKWYVLGGVLVLLTGIMSRVVFKTIKWFLALVALAVIGLAVWQLIKL